MSTVRTVEEASKKLCPLMGGNCRTHSCMAWNTPFNGTVGYTKRILVKKGEQPYGDHSGFRETAREPSGQSGTHETVVLVRETEIGFCEAFAVYTESV